MVTTVNETRTDNTIAKRPPLVVEFVGPAGAGKTTLSQAMSRRSKKILIGAPPDVRSVADIPFFARNALLLMPTLLRLYQNNSRWPTRREIAWMTILKGWHHVLGRQVSNDGTVIVLDQGPVFMLAKLHSFGPESLKSSSAEKWWSGTYNQWAATLDMVIWFDASDTLLLERIRARNCWHRVKEKSEQEAFKFLARYRRSYEQIISALTANGGPRILCFNTDQESLSQIVDKVLAAFDLEHGAG
jgi:shikimate kinase